MCEPAHSIIQYPDQSDDDDHLPMGERLRKSLGEKIVQWGRRIEHWFHYSRLGSGHSEALRSGRYSWNMPKETRYEGLWWERDFIIDGPYSGYAYEESQAKSCAEFYHNEKVMKNMSTFRRFLEVSIKKSDWAESYVTRLLENVLTVEGRNKVLAKMKRVYGPFTTMQHIFNRRKEEATKLIMGFTRKRNLFLPHWADDDKLWTPGQVG